MPTSYTYRCTLEWTGAEAGSTANVATFSRDSRATLTGGATIDLSAAPEFQGDGSRTNPEELFVVSLSTCQMLTYLFLAARNGVQVTGYTDAAEGELAVKDGKLRMTRVTLRPTITIAAGSDPAKAHDLVERAHGDCFIANSVTCDVAIEASIVTQ
jgi:peroxiredoxin-like protein